MNPIIAINLYFNTSQLLFIKDKIRAINVSICLVFVIGYSVSTQSYSQASKGPIRYRADVETIHNTILRGKFSLADTLVIYAQEGLINLHYFQNLYSNKIAMDLKPEQTQFILNKTLKYSNWDKNLDYSEGEMTLYQRKVWQSIVYGQNKGQPNTSAGYWSLASKDEFKQITKINFLELEFENDAGTIKYIHAFDNSSKYLCSFDGKGATEVLKNYVYRPDGDVFVGKLFAPSSMEDLHKISKNGDITGVIIKYDQNKPLSIKFLSDVPQETNLNLSKVLKFDAHSGTVYKSPLTVLLDSDQWTGKKSQPATKTISTKGAELDSQLSFKVWESPHTSPPGSLISELLINPLFFESANNVIGKWSKEWSPTDYYYRSDRVHDRNFSFFESTADSKNQQPGIDSDSSRYYWAYTGPPNLALEFVIRYVIKIDKGGDFVKAPDQIELKLSGTSLGLIDFQQLKSISLNMKSENQEFIKKYLLQQSGEYNWIGCTPLVRGLKLY